jgi:glycosyltransferase involved in cell wall biosynthesis
VPKISVIIPIYNVEKYLSACLDSVLSQTFTDFEAICINDGATDGCGEILSNYAAKDERVQVIIQENSGLSEARNAGLNVAKGEYIYFLDSDDVIHPQLLETALHVMEEVDADVVSFRYQKCSAEKPFVFEPLDVPHVSYQKISNPYRVNKRKYPFNVWTKFYRKSLIDGIKFIPHIHFEDYPFTYHVLSRKPKIIFIDKVLYGYTSNPKSISNAKINPQQIWDYRIGWEYLYNVYADKSLSKERSLVIRYVLPHLLKRQFQLCKAVPQEFKKEMESLFATELAMLQATGWLQLRGNKLKYWLYYQWLLRKAKPVNVVKICGGLGNQLFQYAFGQNFPEVCYDTSFYKAGKSRKLELNLYNIPLKVAGKKFSRGKVKLFKFAQPKMIEETQINRYEPKLLQQNGYFSGFYQTEKYFSAFREKILREFTLKLPLNAVNLKILDEIKKTSSVSLHIRRTDYLSPTVPMEVLDLDYYKRAIDYIMQHVSDPHFFVFSDDPQWVKDNLKIMAPHTFVDVNDGSHGYFDLELMRNCKHNIIANSSFSWWGAWLNENFAKIVVSPNKWFKPTAVEYGGDIIPETWIKL